MYIGPWQEYALQKKKLTQRTEKDALREELERAILGSLDPEAASRALEAMHPLFQGDPQQGGRRASYKRPPPRLIAMPPGQENQVPYKLDMPLLKTGDAIVRAYESSIMSDRSFGGSSTPQSFRSTVSEPTRGRNINRKYPEHNRANVRRLPSLANKSGRQEAGNIGESDNLHREKKSRQHVQKQREIYQTLSDESQETSPREVDGAKQPPYNAIGAVHALRLAKACMRQKQPDYAAFWGWKPKAAAADDEGPAALDLKEIDKGEQSAKSKNELMISKKVERVKRMQQIYTNSNESDNPATPPRMRLPALRTPASPIVVAKEVRPKTPKIVNMNLTDSDLLAISKYFNEVTSSSASPMGQQGGNFDDSPTTTRTSSFAGLTDVNVSLKASNNDRKSPGPEKSPKQPHLIPRPPSGSVPGTPQLAGGMDELYVGGFDGLLRWSNGLEIDDV